MQSRCSLILFTNPFAQAGYDTRSIFKRSLTSLIESLPSPRLIASPRLKNPVYLPIDEGRIIRFIPFPRVLVLCEMRSASSRIWTRVAVSISYDDNHYTTGTSRCSLMNKRDGWWDRASERASERARTLYYENDLMMIMMKSMYTLRNLVASRLLS